MFSKVLELIALALDQHGIPYMLIGGQAVLLYGEPRLTPEVSIGEPLFRRFEELS